MPGFFFPDKVLWFINRVKRASKAFPPKMKLIENNKAAHKDLIANLFLPF